MTRWVMTESYQSCHADSFHGSGLAGKEASLQAFPASAGGPRQILTDPIKAAQKTCKANLEVLFAMTFVPSQVFLSKYRHSSRLLITLITQDTKKKVCSQGFVVMRPRQAPNPRRSNIVGATCCYLQPAASTILPDCRSGTLSPLNFCFHSKLDLPFYSPLIQPQWIITSIYLGPQLRLSY